MAVKPIPEGHEAAIPSLALADAPKMIEFYKRAFGATELTRLAGPDGRIGHAEIKIGKGIVMLADEHLEIGFLSPKTLGAARPPVSIHLYVEDVDALFQRAIQAGATSMKEPPTSFTAIATRSCKTRRATSGPSRLTRKTYRKLRCAAASRRSPRRRSRWLGMGRSEMPMARVDPIERLRKICLALPTATEKEAWGEATFRVGGKMFAMTDNNHHNSGHVSVWCKAPAMVQEILVGSDHARFFVPPYLGYKGWIGVRLNVKKIDWVELATILEDGHRMTAPKRLAAPRGAIGKSTAAPAPPKSRIRATGGGAPSQRRKR